MSGDSPHAHNDIIEYIDGGRSSPAPTTSKDPQPISTSVVQASVLVEPEKDCEESENSLSSPIFNNLTCDDSGESQDNDKTVPLDELDHNGKKKGKNNDRKLNGDADKLDGVWIPNNDPRKKPLEEDEENCAVNCLYYTMQCCECTIL